MAKIDGVIPFQPKKILETLLEHDVESVVLGGIAGTIHGSPLPTSDVDICPAPDPGNLGRLAAALEVLEAKMMATDEPNGIALEWSGARLRKLLLELRVVNLITKYGQLDLIYRPAGTQGYKDLAKGATIKALDNHLEIRVAALSDVIRSKQAAGRQRDLEHLPTLRKLLEISRGQDLPGKQSSEET